MKKYQFRPFNEIIAVIIDTKDKKDININIKCVSTKKMFQLYHTVLLSCSFLSAVEMRLVWFWNREI